MYLLTVLIALITGGKVPADLSDNYANIILEESDRSEVDPLLVIAIIQHETGGRWDPKAVGPTNDYGLMQLHVGETVNAKYRGSESELFDPRKNIEIGAKSLAYWRKFHRRYCKSQHQWWSHYKWGGHVKSNHYANRVTKLYKQLQTWRDSMIVVIEGIDASGKKTQTVKMSKGLGYTRFSFPEYDNTSGQLILKGLKSEVRDSTVHQALMLYNKCLALPKITKLVDAGQSVVLDRYWQSAYAYGVEEGLSGQEMIDMHSVFPQADVNIFLDIPVDLVKQRRPNARDANESNTVKLGKVRDNYRELWDKMSHTSDKYWAVVDGTGSIDEVAAVIYDHVLKVLHA